MSALFPYLTEIHHLRNQVAADSANLKHMRLAPLNTFPRMQIRQHNELVADIGIDTRFVPIISSRARSYTKEKAVVKTAVVHFPEQRSYNTVQIFLTVQQLLDKAARTAGPLSNFGSSALRSIRC
ncbi:MULTISPECIES: hypothetical protein [unclassified Phyllobacterium]|uniref:hypothetical protein n=1 Tax=unclassified Phyllobacterium TaxID=2638441 RepID=UPI003012BA13